MNECDPVGDDGWFRKVADDARQKTTHRKASRRSPDINDAYRQLAHLAAKAKEQE